LPKKPEEGGVKLIEEWLQKTKVGCMRGTREKQMGRKTKGKLISKRVREDNWSRTVGGVEERNRPGKAELRKEGCGSDAKASRINVRRSCRMSGGRRGGARWGKRGEGKRGEGEEGTGGKWGDCWEKEERKEWRRWMGAKGEKEIGETRWAKGEPRFPKRKGQPGTGVGAEAKVEKKCD